MKRSHLPRINPRYWSAIVAASMCGANTGDFLSHVLGLGHTRGLLPLALMFGAVVWAERLSQRAGELYYWLAIIILRTAATNLADLATHDLKLGYVAVELSLASLMVVCLAIQHSRGGMRATSHTQDERALPTADAGYWIVMLLAGTLGTALGDWVADVLGFGVAYGSVVLMGIFGLVLMVSDRYGNMSKPWYWLTIVAARTVGTTLGDFTAGRDGLDLGLPLSTLCTGILLISILMLWRANRQTAFKV